MFRGKQMQESRQLRKTKLVEGIKRHRFSLYAMKFAGNRAPSSVKDKIESRIQEIPNELHKMEDELHELNVQQIREELKGG